MPKTTTVTGKVIELKNIKYAAFASQESHCFSCSIYVDGKKAGTAYDDGLGGMTRIEPPALVKLLDEEAKVRYPDNKLPDGSVVNFDGDVVIGYLMNDYLIERDLKRTLAKKVVFSVKGDQGLSNTKPLPKEKLEQILNEPQEFIKIMETKHNIKIEKILNLLPLDEALEIYANVE